MADYQWLYDHRINHMGDVTLTRLADGATRYLQGDDATEFVESLPDPTGTEGETFHKLCAIQDSIAAEYFSE
jgi:hypothetical protein